MELSRHIANQRNVLEDALYELWRDPSSAAARDEAARLLAIGPHEPVDVAGKRCNHRGWHAAFDGVCSTDILRAQSMCEARRHEDAPIPLRGRFFVANVGLRGQPTLSNWGCVVRNRRLRVYQHPRRVLGQGGAIIHQREVTEGAPRSSWVLRAEPQIHESFLRGVGLRSWRAVLPIRHFRVPKVGMGVLIHCGARSYRQSTGLVARNGQRDNLFIPTLRLRGLARPCHSGNRR